MRNYVLTIFLAGTFLFAGTVPADWQRSPASDVDKEFLWNSVDPPRPDNSCWMATAANMLAGAGYGIGSTIQERAENIYKDLIVWQTSTSNTTGVADGGWTDTALTWWLGSANNVWPNNPFTVVDVYGNKSRVPWANTDGAEDIGNYLREYNLVGISISWPRASANGSAEGGHAVTAWGDSGTSATLTSNPAEVILADSDRNNGGDFQTYTYDSYTNPNPGRFNEGNGWYINFSNNHPFIKHIATLTPTDSPIDPDDGPTQRVRGSFKIRQDQLESATDLHYTAWTDYDILAYDTDIDWPTVNDPPVITEGNNYVPTLTRSEIYVNWDLTDNRVPFNKDVTITTDFILQNWNGIWYDDVYFTYPGEQLTKWLREPLNSSGATGVRVDDYDKIGRMIADDFECTQRGPITQIHLWSSWKNDLGTGSAPGFVNSFKLHIFSDDPDSKYPRPLKLLWSGDFAEFTVREHSTVRETFFWDPYKSSMDKSNRIWQYVIDIPEEEAFWQSGSRDKPKVYWLGVTADVNGEAPEFGWNNTDPKNQWKGAAVAFDPDFKLTDEFNYGEDTKTHSYQQSGSVKEGSYKCETGSLRIGSGDSGAWAQWTAAVGEGHDAVKLRYRIPWGSGGSLYVDGKKVETLKSDACNMQELVLSGMTEDTKDGKIEIRIVDELNGHEGDTQITYMEVLSAAMAWSVLHYPGNHPYDKSPVDMAFAVVTRAGKPGAMMPSFGWDIVTPRLENINQLDITGGYVVGAFDLYDTTDESFVSEYRFVHQYPYTQDPESHTFNLKTQKLQANIVATNFRFGHSYGMPSEEELWNFGEWMTKPQQKFYFDEQKQLSMSIDWKGRLPYPSSDITSASEMPDALDCTVYLEGDINKDCCVDMLDLNILARDWLSCTRQDSFKF